MLRKYQKINVNLKLKYRFDLILKATQFKTAAYVQRPHDGLPCCNLSFWRLVDDTF